MIICGFGRIGQSVAQFLEAEQVPYLALDLHPTRVHAAHAAGHPVCFGDAAERETLTAVGIADARLLMVSFDQVAAALRILHHVREIRPDMPVIGARGRNPWLGLTLGSVSLAVTQGAPCPVLVVK